MREQGLLDPAHLIFIDETAVSTNMVRPNGWSPRGERLVGHLPMGHWKMMTFIAGFRQTGIVAPMVIKEAMNGEAFPRRTEGNRSCRRNTALLAAVFSGPQSN